MKNEDGDVELSVKVNAKSVSAKATYTLQNSFMALAGLSTSEITVSSEVQRVGDVWAEVVMVLDYSGSMKKNDKYIRMAKGAINMVDSLKDTIDGGRLKVGLVPFSAMVYASMPAKHVTQAAKGGTWTGCTQDGSIPTIPQSARRLRATTRSGATSIRRAKTAAPTTVPHTRRTISKSCR